MNDGIDYSDDCPPMTRFIPPEAELASQAPAELEVVDDATNQIEDPEVVNAVGNDVESAPISAIAPEVEALVSAPDEPEGAEEPEPQEPEEPAVPEDSEVAEGGPPETSGELEVSPANSPENKQPIMDLNDPRLVAALMSVANQQSAAPVPEEPTNAELQFLRELLVKSFANNPVSGGNAQPPQQVTGTAIGALMAGAGSLAEGVGSLAKGVGSALGSTAEGVGGLAKGVGSGAGNVVSGVGNVIGGAGNLVAAGFNSIKEGVERRAINPAMDFSNVRDVVVGGDVPLVPRLSEYRVNATEKSEQSYIGSQEQFWAPNAMAAIKRDIEERARVTGLSVPDVMAKMRPDGEMAELHKKFVEAVANSPECIPHKRNMDKALESWSRQFGRGEEEVAGEGDSPLSPHYESMRERMTKSKERMQEATTNMPLLDGEDKSHAERLRETIAKIAEKVKEFIESLMRSVRGPAASASADHVGP